MRQRSLVMIVPAAFFVLAPYLRISPSILAREPIESSTPADTPPARELTLNLADEPSNQDIEVRISPGTYSVRVINLIPGVNYNPIFGTEFVPQPPLQWPSPVATKVVPEASGPPDPCEAVRSGLADLRAAESEAAVPAKAASLRDALTALGPTAVCTSRQAAEDALNATSLIQGNFPIQANVRLTVTLSRTAKDGHSLRWNKIFTTGPTGRFVTSYAFSFVLNNDDQYFAKAVGSQYVVTHVSGHSKFDFVPSIFFTWLPTRGRCGWWGCPTAGLGYDLTAPVVFIGDSIVYHENLALIAGGAMHQALRLNGQYSAGQTIQENLTKDQLHEKVYRVAAFVGVSYRFDSNIFGRDTPAAAARNPAASSPTKTPTTTLTPVGGTPSSTATPVPVVTPAAAKKRADP